MVATSHAISTAVGLDILRRGGNAMDAAVAACAVQCVVEPESTGIGGDNFCIYAPEGSIKDMIAFNGSGRAPAAATAEWYEEQGITTLERQTPHAVIVPGVIDAWETLTKNHGTMELGELLQPAIEYARDGYPISSRVSTDFKSNEALLRGCPNASRVFLPGGRLPECGEMHYQPELAATLEKVAQHGRDAYRALLASLRGDGEDEEYADALRARDGDDEDDDEDDDDEVDDDSRETADDEDAAGGSARASAPIPEDRRDPEGRSSRPLDPEEIDEDPSDDSDADADDADAEDPASDSDPSPSAAASRPSAADDDSASGGLATHLARVVDDRTAARLASLKKPEWARATPARDELRVPASSRKKGLSRGKAPSSRRPLDEDDAWESGGAWELDASARADGAAEALTDAPAAPEGLPPKLLERWNATRRSSSSSDAFPAPPPSKKKRAGNEDDARSPPSGPAASNRALPFASRAQAELYALLDQYRDVFYPARAYPGAPSDAPGAAEATDAVLLHVARHVLRTRRRVTKNNEALARRAKAEEAAREAKRMVERRERLAIGDEGGEDPEGDSKEGPKDPGGGSKKEGPKGGSKGGSNARKPARVKVSDDLPRDQGFARPTVLILVPMRNVAGRLVRRLLEFLPSANTGKADAVSKLDRLAEDFGGRFDDELDDRETEKRRKKGAWVPEDHAGTFRGNVDDHFRLGVKVTKASVRLFVDFFGSDVLIASPLGEYARSSPRDKGLFFFFFFFWGGVPFFPPPPLLLRPARGDVPARSYR